ncbi:hypothetical protein V493_00784 [Pseudogymnoascus sp. VKM F-4281 (FW-2241)]|nr:hypothetical protein V493_00784 [Pseudogymnoascus sp. VKM F-4281 (FW-2241)]
MGDPLTAVGIVANIVQLVDFSAKVLARLDDFQSNLGEIPKAFRHIKAELPVLKDALKQTKDKIDHGTIEDSAKTALLPAVQGCRIQIEALDGLLAETLPVAGDSRLKKTTKALWSITQDGKVEIIRKTLHRYIATLTFYHAAASSTLQPMKDSKLVEIRRWLSAPDPSINYRKALNLRQSDTGLWLLESEIYSKWKSNASSFVWLYGIPGCGKTILSSTVTEDILIYCANDPGKVVAYFYFDFTDADKQKAERMVHSLISQLSEQCIQIPLGLEALYSSSDKGNRQPSLDALINVLQKMLQDFPQSYLILDALDECVDRSELMRILEQMAGWQLEEMRVLVTSRKERDIESSLEDIVNRECIICLQHEVVDKDIQGYVRQRLSDDKGLKKWQEDAEIRREIETSLMERSRGMFRWAVCQMDTLGKCRTRLALQKALKALPITLDETYERILCTISEEDSEYAMRILQWLAFSSGPLSVGELAEVVAINVEQETAFNRDEVLQDPMEVLDICMSLVSVVMTDIPSLSELNSRSSTTVTLAHYSVQEYLVSARICQGRAARYSMRPAPCHSYIAKGSIGYLLQFGKGLFDCFESAESLQQVYALAQYSAEHWIFHTRNGEEDDNRLSCLVTKFLSTGDGAYWNWLRLNDPDDLWKQPNFEKEFDSCPNPLYYASRGGLANIASLLVEEGADVNAQGGDYGNALQAASRRGHDKIVEVLLSKGADVNMQGGSCYNALQAASAGGHDKIVEVLLSKGADVNAQGEYYSNALQAASAGGHDKIVNVLLSKGADVNAQGDNGNALQWASARGHDEIVEALLSKGADVNAQGGDYGNALQAASAQGHGKIAEVLLSKGADVDAHGGDYGNALQAASVWCRDKIVEVLLSKGADVNAQGGDYGSALQAASASGHDKIVEVLLSKGADVNAQGGDYGNALQAASDKGHDKIVELLLSRGADVNAQGGRYGNALQAASYQSHDKIIEMLLSKGADVNAQGGRYGNALQGASAGGHDKIVELLLSRGADVNAQGGDYGNALQAASYQSHDKIVEVLLSKGADVNAQGGDYGNALQAASVWGQDNIVEVLLSKGADVNAQGGRYSNALQAASAGGYGNIEIVLLSKVADYDKIVEVLLSKGADVNAQGGCYGNALQAASEGGHNKIVEALLRKGADVNAQGGRYGNALQGASIRGHDKIVGVLLSKGADVNAQGGDYGNALQAASYPGYDKVVEVLLSKGAEVNAQGGYYGNALQAASVWGHDKIVEVLLSKGADVNAQGGDYGNALQAASDGGHDNIVEVLLSNGAVRDL